MQTNKDMPRGDRRGTRATTLGGTSSLLALMTAGLFASAAVAQNTLPQGASTDGAAAVTADQATPPNPAEQTSPTAGPRADAPGGNGGQEIVVTGSRIARRDYSAPSPIVTANESLLKQSATSAIEQNLNKLPQFTPTNKVPSAGGGDIQPNATNTPGSAVVSLRGLGANRSLVLIDGRRGTPSNALGVVDINSIPSIAVERVEIITGGASATYGADAVAGVINFILKKNFSGFQFDASNSISQRGDGDEYTISGIIGANFADNRGNVTFAMSTNERQGSNQIDRPWYRSLYQNPNIAGNGFFPIYGGYQTDPANLPTVSALNANIRGGTFTAAPAAQSIYVTPQGAAFSGFNVATLGGIGGAPVDGTVVKKLSNGTLGYNFTNPYLIYPLTRYNAYARGTYELSDNISVFGQALFAKSSSDTIQQPSPVVTGWSVLVNPAIDRAVIPTSLLNILDSRPNPNAPFQLVGNIPGYRTEHNDVYNYNLVAGLQGKIPSIDWTYEVFGSRGESETTAFQGGIASLQRFQAVVTQPNFGAGYTVTGNQGPPNYGFGATTATCTSGVNLFNPGSITQDCLNAIGATLKTKSQVHQTVWEGDAQGPLFRLPAGEVRVAIGADYRRNGYQFQNDNLSTQGEDFLEQAIGIYPSGNSGGTIKTSEAYAETVIPILRDLPFVKELTLEAGGRYSHYNTTGTSWTYKVQAEYATFDWLRFRGGYNRAERTPNVAELYLARQQSFQAAAGGDLCSINSGFADSANPDRNPNYQKTIALCGQLMEKSGQSTADNNYYGVDYRTLTSASPSAVRALVTQPQSTGGGFIFPTQQGNANLTPETADTYTAGMVISSPWKTALLSRLRMSVDYYHIKVRNAIALQNDLTLQQQCLDPAFNPNYDVNSAACAATPRNATGALGNIVESYVNSGRFMTSGIDAQLDWGFQAGPGTVSLNSVFNYLLHARAAALQINPMVDYAGTQGPNIDGLDGFSYRWKLFTTLGYTLNGLYLGVQWRHLPSIKNNLAALQPTAITGVPKAYNLFNLQGNLAITRDIAIRFGVDNLLDKAPPLEQVTTNAVSPNLQGGAFDSQNYDVFGRSFYFGVNFKF